jgi:hypothetical protein
MAHESMSTQSPDTDAEAERLQIRILRAMPVWARIAQIDALNSVAEAFTMAGLRRVHARATDAQLRELVRGQRLRSVDAAPLVARSEHRSGDTP